MYTHRLFIFIFLYVSVCCIHLSCLDTYLFAAPAGDVYVLSNKTDIKDTIDTYNLLNRECNVCVRLRLIKNNTIQPLSLPFNVSKQTLSDPENPLCGATIQKYVATRHLRHNGKDSVIFALETVDSIIAGLPYFVHWINGDGSILQEAIFKNVVIVKNKSTPIDTFSTNLAIVYSSLSPLKKEFFAEEGHKYMGINNDGSLSFFDTDLQQGDDSILGFKAYILLSDALLNELTDNVSFHFGNIEDYYLCFTSQYDGIGSIQLMRKKNAEYVFLQYKYAKDTLWTDYEYNILPLTYRGQKIYFRASQYNKVTGSDKGGYNYFTSTKPVAASGSVMSLLDPTAQMTATSYRNTFIGLFDSCRYLTSPPELTAIELSDHCYASMFAGCTSLKWAPELPAENLAPYCYYKLFDGCVSLKECPELPAQQLKIYCYGSMFLGCVSIEKPPVLPSLILGQYCYANMFENCTKLIYAPLLPATDLEPYCYYKMFSNCSRLIEAPQLQANTLKSLCYANMFEKCSSLKKAPQLPAMNLKENCYAYMFSECTALEEAPELPAKNLTRQCYAYMFNKCKSLTKAPVLHSTTLYDGCYLKMFSGCEALVKPPMYLPAKVLKQDCYYMMFSNCTSLQQSPIIMADQLATNACYAMFDNCTSLDTITVLFKKWTENGSIMWVNNVSPYGIFIAPCELPQIYSESNIPTGWRYLCKINLYDTIPPYDTLDMAKNKIIQVNIHTDVLKNNTIRSLTLPFDLSTDEINKPGNPLFSAKLFQFLTTYQKKTNTLKDTLLYILEEVDSIKAGEPYFIQWEQTAQYDSVNPLIFKSIWIGDTNWTKQSNKTTCPATVFPLLAPLRIDSIPQHNRNKYIYPKDNGALFPFSVLNSDDSLYGFRAYWQICDSMFSQIKDSNAFHCYGRVTDYALCFEAQQEGSFVQLDSICTGHIGIPPEPLHLLYSVDTGKSWLNYTWQPDDGKGMTIRLKNIGDRVYFVAKDKNPTMNYTFFYNDNKFSIHYQFILNGKIKASGDIMSLLDHTAQQSFVPDSAFFKLFYNCNALITPPLLPAMFLSPYCYANMFEGCTSLVSFPRLSSDHLATACYKSMFEGCFSLICDSSSFLPATYLPPFCYDNMFKDCYALLYAPTIYSTKASLKSCNGMFENCFALNSVQDSLYFQTLVDSFTCSNMFANCTSLVIAPQLSACVLSDWCFYNMFGGCSSLIYPPRLNTLTLTQGCYAKMFKDCQQLKFNYTLPATNLQEKCYYEMFNGCKKIDTISVSFSEWLPLNATTRWVENVNREGLFIAPCGLEDIRGINNIPDKWKFSCVLDLYDTLNPSNAILPYLDSTIIVDIHTHISKNGTIRALSLPFNLSNAEIAIPNNPLHDATILAYKETKVVKAHDDHDSVIFVLDITDSIIAGKPYFIQWTNKRNTELDIIRFKDVKPVKTFSIEQDSFSDEYAIVYSNLAPVKINEIPTEKKPFFVFPLDDGSLLPLSSYQILYDSLLGFRNYFILSNSLYENIKLNNPTFHLDNINLHFLCFTASENNDKIILKRSGDPGYVELQYSFSGSVWKDYSINATILLEKKDDRVYFVAKKQNETFSNSAGNYYFTFDKQTSCTGNIMSLLDRKLQRNDVPSMAFERLFASCTTLISAPQLPAKNVGKDAYSAMFMNCSSLRIPPDLPATELATRCYNRMFFGCSSLTSTPELPATQLAHACYEEMFALCSSLKTITSLPATELKELCYRKMFMGCASLTTICQLPEISTAPYCCEKMFTNCSKLDSIPNFCIMNITDGCCKQMFENCISLTSIPLNLLPAQNLSKECYKNMFTNCTSLAYTPLLPSTNLATQCYQAMFSSCTSLQQTPCLPASKTRPLCYDSMFYNCSNLQYNDSVFAATDLTYKCCSHMFEGCSSLKNIPTLSAKKLAPACYQHMFAHCINLTNLYPNDTLLAMQLADACYYGMFTDCQSLKQAPTLIATSLVSNCYNSMFAGCTNLCNTQPNDTLPAINLADSCYFAMYKNCSSLKTAPYLPATNLSNSCYTEMFYGCTSLKQSPFLHSVKLEKHCYDKMFEQCINMNFIIVKFDDWYLRYTDEDFFSPIYTNNWIKGVADSGVFVAPCNLLNKRGDSYIPKNWTFINEITSIYDTISPQKTLMKIRGCSNKLQVHRNFIRNGNYNTVALPFDCDSEEIAKPNHPLHGVEIYELADAQIKNGKLYLFVDSINYMYAGFPYLLRWTEKQDTLKNPIFDNIYVKIDRIEDGYSKKAKSGLITMYSTFSPYILNNRNTIYNIDGHPDFYYLTNVNTIKINGFRGFFITNNVDLPANIDVVIDKNTNNQHSETNIHKIATTTEKIQKVLINGRLFFIKNHKIYDILGNIIL